MAKGPPITFGLNMLGRQRVVPAQAAQAGVDGAVKAEQARRQAEQAARGAQHVQRLANAVRQNNQAQGQRLMPLRPGFQALAPDFEDRTIWGDWAPGGAPSMSEIRRSVAEAHKKGEIDKAQYQSAEILLEAAKNRDWKAASVLPKIFAEGRLGAPRSHVWCQIARLEAMASYVETFGKSMSQEDFSALANSQPTEQESAEPRWILDYALRRADKSLVRAGNWVFLQRNNGVAPITYEVELYKDGTLAGHQVAVGGVLAGLLGQQLQRFDFDRLQQGFERQMSAALNAATFTGEWSYAPGPGRRLSMQWLVEHAALGQAVDGIGSFELAIVGKRQDPEPGLWTLQVQDLGQPGARAGTGEWWLTLNSFPADYASPSPKG